MLEKGKISAFQMAIMMYPTIIGTSIIAAPVLTVKYAGNDLWLSPIWASVTGFLTVYIAFQLHKLYPNQTITQYIEHIIGWFPGKILGLLYLFFYIQMNGQGIRIYADFIVDSFLPQTPVSVIIATMILVCAFAVHAGLEVLGRISQLFFPVFIFPLFIMIVLLFPDFEFKSIFPIMESGVLPSLKGGLIPQGWLAEFLLIAFLLPFLTDIEKGRKWGMISVFTVMLTLVIVNLLILFLFTGNLASNNYPLLKAARYISIANFFENLEAAIIAVWVLGNFVKFSVVYYCLVLGTAQWLNLSDYRPIVWPLGILTAEFSFWSFPSTMEVGRFDLTFPFYSPLVQTLIPLLLLFIAIIRKEKKTAGQKE